MFQFEDVTFESPIAGKVKRLTSPSQADSLAAAHGMVASTLLAEPRSV
jgi:hypothetical protein